MAVAESGTAKADAGNAGRATECRRSAQRTVPSARFGTGTQVNDNATIFDLYGTDNLYTLLSVARDHFSTRPKADGLDGFLFDQLLQSQDSLNRRGLLTSFGGEIVELGDLVVKRQFKSICAKRGDMQSRLRGFFDDPEQRCTEDRKCCSTCQENEHGRWPGW